jgi:hypothetical protein
MRGLNKGLIELTQKMIRIHAPHVEGHFGADASNTLLCAAEAQHPIFANEVPTIPRHKRKPFLIRYLGECM